MRGFKDELKISKKKTQFSFRPSFITLYVENVDHAGHSDGPDSDEVNKQLKIADQAVGYLLEGLRQKKLENCVNIIILADHGDKNEMRRKEIIWSYEQGCLQYHVRGSQVLKVMVSIWMMCTSGVEHLEELGSRLM